MGGREKEGFAKQMSGALCRGGLEQVQGERKSTLLQLLRCRCVHRKISWRWMKAGERMRRWPRSVATTRKKRGEEEEKKKKKKKTREKSGKERPTSSARERTHTGWAREPLVMRFDPRGRSEFGYLIRERGRKGVVESLRERAKRRKRGRAQVRGVCLDPRLFFSRQPHSLLAANGITRDPALQTALYSPLFLPPFFLPTSCWDELTIDRIDTVAAGESHVCAGWKRVFRPRPSPLSSSRNCIRPPSDPPPSPRPFRARTLTLLSLFSITRLLRREEGGEEGNAARPAILVFFYATLKYPLFRFMKILWIRRRTRVHSQAASCHR